MTQTEDVYTVCKSKASLQLPRDGTVASISSTFKLLETFEVE